MRYRISLLLPLLLASPTSTGCALLYGFDDGAQGGAAATTASSATGQVATASSGNSASSSKSASTGAPIDCVDAPPPELFESAPLVFIPETLVQRGDTLLAVVKPGMDDKAYLGALNASFAASVNVGMDAVFEQTRIDGGKGAPFFTAQPGLIQTCALDLASACATNIPDTEDLALRGVVQVSDDVLVYARLENPVIALKRFDLMAGTHAFAGSIPVATAGLVKTSYFDQTGDGFGAGDTIFVRSDETFGVCLFDATPGTFCQTVGSQQIAGLRDVAHRASGNGVGAYFVDVDGDIRLWEPNNTTTWFSGIQATHLAFDGANLVFEGKRNGTDTFFSCDAAAGPGPACKCASSPGHVDQMVAAPGGNAVFIVAAGKLYRWATS